MCVCCVARGPRDGDLSCVEGGSPRVRGRPPPRGARPRFLSHDMIASPPPPQGQYTVRVWRHVVRAFIRLLTYYLYIK